MNRFTALFSILSLLAISSPGLAQTSPPPTNATPPNPGNAPPGAVPPSAAPPGAAPPSATPPAADPSTPPPPVGPDSATLEASPLLEPTAQAQEAAPPPSPPAEEEAPARPKRNAGPFSKGNIGISIMAGTSVIGPKDYLLLGLGLGYYVVDGLELGVDGTIWLFEDPTIGTVTPKATYVLHMVPVIKPYAGAFWRRYIINDYDDFSSVGARLGAYLVTGRGSYLGLGAVFEHIIDCNESVRECDDVYPELVIGIAIGR